MKRLLTVIACVLVLPAFASTVKVGFAVRDITPKAEDIKNGIPISGWSGKKSKEVQQGDKLCVRAMAMRDTKGTLLVILTADTLKFHHGDAYMLQNWFEKTFKVNRWHLIMNASHTHQAPNSYYFTKNAYCKTYNDILIKAVKSAIAEAVQNANTPMNVKFAKLQIRKDMLFNKVYNGYNYQASRAKVIREGKAEGYKKLAAKFNFTDTDLPVFVFSDAGTGKIKGFLWSVAAHPTYLGSGAGGMRVSSHAPGAVTRALKKIYGSDVVCMFAQGAAGDLKMKFPDFPIKYKYFPATKTRGYIWTQGPDKGKEITQQQYVRALDGYAKLYTDIIKEGFKENKFREIKDIDLKIAGTQAKIPLSLQRPPKTSKIGQRNRCYWTRPKGTVDSYRKIIADSNSTEQEKNKAYEELGRIYDDKHAAYVIWFTKVMFNKHFQLVAMSDEVCCEIGMEVKKYYQSKGIETVFFGYSPFGSPYYPSNLHHREGTYQGSFMHPDKGFDFNKFALDNVIKLEPR